MHSSDVRRSCGEVERNGHRVQLDYWECQATGLRPVHWGWQCRAEHRKITASTFKRTADMTQAHVLDVVPFMLQIIELAASGPAQGSVYSRWYNVETQRVAWKDLAGELAKVMHKREIFSTAEAKSVGIEEAGQGEVKYLVAGNMLMKTNRSAKMGFKPSQPSILVQIHEDLKDVAL
jgi:hypothetical protein